MKGKARVSNVLPAEKRLRVLAALVDGNSERAVTRMTDVSRAAVSRFGLALGIGAQRLHDRLVRGLLCELIQADEIWSYVGKKQARVTAADAPGIGETYSFAGMDTASRLVISWRVGRRDMDTCGAFVTDLRSRLLLMPQITTDGFAPYIVSVAESFGLSVDFMQTVKNYRTGSTRGPDHRYEPPRGIDFITKTTVFGAPDAAKASTAYIERLNGTTRHLLGRMRRLCYAFSKCPEHHRAAVGWCPDLAIWSQRIRGLARQNRTPPAVALHYTYWNLCWIVRTLRVTPAMEAGLTGHVWSLEEFLDALLSEPAGDAPQAQPMEHRQPKGPARELPGGRGFLRLVEAPTPALRRPTVQPEPPSPAPVTPVHDAPPVEPSRQLDLLAWRPKPRTPKQLSLFPDLATE